MRYVNQKKSAYITLNARSKQEELEKILEPSSRCLGEVANAAIFECKENVALTNTATSSISPKRKRKIALYNNNEFY